MTDMNSYSCEIYTKRSEICSKVKQVHIAGKYITIAQDSFTMEKRYSTVSFEAWLEYIKLKSCSRTAFIANYFLFCFVLEPKLRVDAKLM